jgi:hypothetical protein
MIAKLLPANRVAAIATWLTALGALIAAVEGTFPQSWQNTAVAAVALITKLVVTVHFMSGAQKFDALSAGAPASGPRITVAPGPTPDQILAEIAAVTSASAAVQAAPGTPADQVTAGLTPDPAPA